jgi:hypothetical protein
VGDLVIFWRQSSSRSGKEQAEHPQRYCQYCSAEVRPGSRFCVSCWKPANSGTRDFRTTTETRTRRIRPRRPDSPEAVRSGTASDPSTSTDSVFQNLYYGFRVLPLVSKAIYIGLFAIVLLTILSPLTFLAGVVSIAVSTIVSVVRALNHRPWGRWAVIAAIAVLPTLAAGSIANTLYGIPFSGSNAQLSTEEQRYVNQVGEIQEAMKQRLDANARILNKYPSIPPLEREQVYDHYFSEVDLKKMAEEKVKVPPGCEEHYENWLEDLNKATATLYASVTLLDTTLTTKAPRDHTSSNELRRDADTSFEESDQLLYKIRRQGCER